MQTLSSGQKRCVDVCSSMSNSLLLLIFLPKVARGKGWGEQGGGRELCWEAPHVLLRGVQRGGGHFCVQMIT